MRENLSEQTGGKGARCFASGLFLLSQIERPRLEVEAPTGVERVKAVQQKVEDEGQFEGKSSVLDLRVFDSVTQEHQGPSPRCGIVLLKGISQVPDQLRRKPWSDGLEAKVTSSAGVARAYCLDQDIGSWPAPTRELFELVDVLGERGRQLVAESARRNGSAAQVGKLGVVPTETTVEEGEQAAGERRALSWWSVRGFLARSGRGRQVNRAKAIDRSEAELKVEIGLAQGLTGMTGVKDDETPARHGTKGSEHSVEIDEGRVVLGIAIDRHQESPAVNHHAVAGVVEEQLIVMICTL